MDHPALEQVLSTLAGIRDDRSLLVLDDLAATSAAILEGEDVGLQVRVPEEPTTDVGASTERARQAEEEQLIWGEGPTWDALRRQQTVLVEDLAGDGRWLLARGPLLALGVHAVRSYPLQVGASRFGCVTDYRRRPGRAGADEVAWGIEVARALTLVWLASRSGGGPASRLPDDAGRIADLATDQWAVVHQAAGMVAVQVGCAVDEAMARLGARAFAEATPIVELAQQVVARELRFRP